MTQKKRYMHIEVNLFLVIWSHFLFLGRTNVKCMLGVFWRVHNPISYLEVEIEIEIEIDELVYTRSCRITSRKWFTFSSMTSLTTALFLIALARCANLNVLKVSLLQLQYWCLWTSISHKKKKQGCCKWRMGQQYYLCVGEIAQTIANLAFPPRDSCNKNVSLESL